MGAKIGGIMVLGVFAAVAGVSEGDALQTVALLLAGGAAWGDLKASVRELGRRVDRIESDRSKD